MLKGKRVLVTGAGGFIGSHLVEALVTLGARVRGFVRYNSRGGAGFLDGLNPKIKQEVDIVFGDLRDYESVEGVCRGSDIVFHLGALIAIPYSYIHPQEVAETNIFGTLNVLNACRRFEVERLIHTSTSEVYGTAKYVPIDEAHPFQPQSPYSASKIAADALCESYYRSFKTPLTILRPFNTYGPRQSGRSIIPTIITQALSREDVYLGSLHPTRDFTYITDTVDGFIRIAESPGVIGYTINLGSGIEVSVGELAKKVFSLIGKSCMIVKDERRVRPDGSEVERLVCDYRKAEALLDWRPKVSLDEGLRRTIEWIRENLSFYKVDVYNV